MIPRRKHLIKYAAKVFDLGALVVSFGLATIALYSSPGAMTLRGFMAVRVRLDTCLLFALLLIVWHSLFALCGLYISKRLTSRRTEFLEVVKASSLASLFLLFAAKAFDIGMVRPIFVAIFLFACTGLMVVGRFTARLLLLALRRRGRNSRFLLIIGTNRRAIEFAQQIMERPELGYNIVGFVDDHWDGIWDFEATGHVRCCALNDLADFLRHNVVDEAAIYLPLRSQYEYAAQLVGLCEEQGIAIRFESQIFNLRTASSRIRDLDEPAQVLAVAGPMEALPSLAKRVIDLAFSATLTLLLAPLLFLVAIAVKLSSPGPVLFRQSRVGLNKRHFTMYKFRTMVADAEKLHEQLVGMNEMTGPAFKITQDPRVTPLGRVLRKTSIDELPQLFNVLQGDMSLVGPRAMSVRDYKLFDQDWQRRRFSVKPGITCLWQVNGRNSIPFEKWMELDMQYIDTWSLWLDLKILVQTVPAVLRGTGAA